MTGKKRVEQKDTQKTTRKKAAPEEVTTSPSQAQSRRSDANKTVATSASVTAFIDAVDDERRKRDAKTLLRLMKTLTGRRPKMWGTQLVGFGQYHYRYDSGREGDFFRTGFSPRKTAMSVYIMSGFSDHQDLLARLGKHKTGKSCLYLTDLDHVDRAVLEELIRRSLAYMDKEYGPGR